MTNFATPAPTTTSSMRFDSSAGIALEAAFDGGTLTSDGGLPWLARIDSELGLCEAIAEHVPDWRGEGSVVRHSLLALVRQRVFQIACGYEDQNDADTLRTDPLFKLACGRLPQATTAAAATTEQQQQQQHLASQPTLSRLENAPGTRECYRMASALGELYIQQRGKAGGGPPKKVVLDFDSTDDPVHGEQEGSHYHGYYGQHMYHPLVVLDGETGQLVTVILRPGNAHASHEALAILKRIVLRLRAAWPEVEIELRADAGFAIPAIYEYCEEEGMDYTIGLIPNSRLEEIAAPLLAKAKEQYEAERKRLQRQQQQQQEQQKKKKKKKEGQEQQNKRAKARLFDECIYRAGSWEHERRVVFKAEAMEEGTNTRFVVTSRKKKSKETPQRVYEWYVGRGESENRIKDLKLYLKADRLSCSKFIANQFRLLLHAAAYWLLDELRRKLVGAGIERMQFDTLRLRVIKIGGRVRRLLRCVKLHLASGHPGQRLWQTLNEMAHE